jgi:hypothetical protein
MAPALAAGARKATDEIGGMRRRLIDSAQQTAAAWSGRRPRVLSFCVVARSAYIQLPCKAVAVDANDNIFVAGDSSVKRVVP